MTVEGFNPSTIETEIIIISPRQGSHIFTGDSDQTDTAGVENKLSILLRNIAFVGEDGGTCTVTRIASGGAATLHCLGTNSLPGGQISVQGLTAPGEPFELAITGGTGRYRKARGQVIGENTSPTEMSIKLVLR